jgi:hypothetical protein
MMTEILLTYFQLLKTEKLVASKAPKALLKNVSFKNMINNSVILKTKVGAGYVYELNPVKIDVFNSWLVNSSPNSDIEITDKASSIAKLKDSKQYKEKSTIIFLRGNKETYINNQIIDLNYYTEKFGFFACVLENVETEKLCIVENKESFLKVEKVISKDYVFIHSYGRVGKNLLEKINTEELLVFSDYDYVGLNEYLVCKSVFKNTTFFVPTNYALLFSKYAKPINLNRIRGQKPSERVVDSKENVVVKIYNDLQTTQKFLEQESLLIDL